MCEKVIIVQITVYCILCYYTLLVYTVQVQVAFTGNYSTNYNSTSPYVQRTTS